MDLLELRKIRDELSEKLYGKSAEEINAILKPGVDKVTRRIEELRKEKEESEEAKIQRNKDFEEKVKGVCNAILTEWKNSYQNSLKSLGENMKLYNDVKNIIEEKPKTVENNKAKPLKK